VHRRAIGVARFLAHFLTPTPRSRARAIAQVPVVAPARPRNVARRRLYRRHLVLRLTSDRTLPIAIGLIVLMAAGVSLAPAATPVGAAQANATGVRLAIGGGAAGLAALDGPVIDSTDLEQADGAGYVDDGTLYKPVAVDTSIQSSAAMLRHYQVKEGDSLTGIASRFGVSMMTLWWANKISTKDGIHVGQELIIPPVTGLVVTVKAGDTLDSLAAANKIDAQQIIEVNNLEDTNLIVGQVLVLPGAKGAPMPTPTPTPAPTKKPSTSTSSGGAGVGPSYSGGSWAWPVIGGNNYISQYFHSYHLGIDIAASYGSTIVAARPGTVVFAGWKSGGGGYQVFIYHGSGLYTAYLHMSSVAVTTGQAVAKGQRIGRVGASGNATGPHCHFAVSVGWPWRSGSYFVNPLRYY
jgi:murein DD-endopeptidase MepM/ murein hydrolase activator NlpD